MNNRVDPTQEDQPPLLQAVGGPLGIAESVLPAIGYVTTYTLAGQNLRAALTVAIGLGAVFALGRIVRRQTLQYALAGLAGLALSAFLVSRSGRAEDFFLPGLLANAGYTAVCVISILARWPLVGVIVAGLQGGGSKWRGDANYVRRCARATWIWAGLCLLRLAVQLPLYLGGALTALGVARVALGVPLSALGFWLTWLLLRPRS